MPQDSNLPKGSKELLPSLIPRQPTKEETEKEIRLRKAREKFEKEQIEITVIPIASSGKKGAPQRRTIRVSSRPRKVPYQREEFEENEEKFSITDTEFMQMPTNEVMYGSPHHVIDSMPQMMRMLVEDQMFVAFSNRLFKMVDPEAQAVSYLANRKLVREGEKLKLLPVKNRQNLEGYEYNNGAGIDEEELYDWKDGGKSPALLSFTKDIMPDHQCDEAQLVILETASEETFVIPEAEDFMFRVLSGKADLLVENAKGKKEYELNVNDRVLLEGLKLATISCQSETDLVVIIGKTTRDEEDNDMLDHAMSHGYQDVHTMHEPEAEQTEHESSELNAEFEETVNEDTVESHFVPEGITPDLSRLDEDIPSNIHHQIKAYYRETNGKIEIEEWRRRKRHKKFIELISLSLDSPYSSKGFRAPAPRWERIIQDTESIGSLKAQERNELFRSLHARAKNIRSYKQLYSPTKWKCPKCGFLNEHKGFDCRNKKCPMPNFANKNGFYAQLKEKNAHDRDIGKAWSEQPQKAYDEETGEFITVPSAFHQKREAFIEKLRSEGCDERAIERKLWHFFDRQAGKQMALYQYTVTCKCGLVFKKRISITKTNKLECPGCKENKNFASLKSELARNRSGKPIKTRTVEESVWRQKRNEAFQDLYCTKAQWNTIYKQVEIQKRRIRLAESLTQDRQDAYNELRSLFRDCDSIQELADFRTKAYEQRIEIGGEISKPSLMDRVSFGDERRVIAAISARQREIAEEMRKKKNS